MFFLSTPLRKRGMRGRTPLVLDLGTRWSRVVNSGTHLVAVLVGHRTGMDVLKDKSLASTGIGTSNSPICSTVAIPTALPGSLNNNNNNNNNNKPYKARSGSIESDLSKNI
jgi:hypothetical protein